MRRIFLVCTLGLLINFVACTEKNIVGKGTILTEERTLGKFNKVNASGSTNVYITQGPEFKIELKGYKNLLPYFVTRVNNHTLELGYKNGISIKNDNVEVVVTLPVLTAISLSGSGNIITTGNFESDNFETHVSGSGNINFSQGTTKNYISSIAGSGNINTYGLGTQNADISISGSGNIEVNATANLKVKISGSGNVYYKNTPAIQTRISGSGAVIPN